MGMFVMETMIGRVAEVVLVLGVAVFGLLGLFVSRRHSERDMNRGAAEDSVYFEDVISDEGDTVLNRVR